MAYDGYDIQSLIAAGEYSINVLIHCSILAQQFSSAFSSFQVSRKVFDRSNHQDCQCSAVNWGKMRIPSQENLDFRKQLSRLNLRSVI